jgi:hypothetical protein
MQKEGEGLYLEAWKDEIRQDWEDNNGWPLPPELQAEPRQVQGCNAPPTTKDQPRQRKAKGDTALMIEAALDRLIETEDYSVGSKAEVIAHAAVVKSTGHYVFRTNATVQAKYKKYCGLRSGRRGPEIRKKSNKQSNRSLD